MTIAETIKKLRTEHGLSTSELAKRAGISRAYLWQLENGNKARPTLDVVQRLADALGVRAAEFCDTRPAEKPGVESEELPLGLEEFVKTRGKALGVRKGDIESMKNVRFRGRQAESVEDWEYLFLSLKRWVQ